MRFQRFLIAPQQSGLEKDVKPWLISDDAYSTLTNAYVWRGRVRKRFGSQTFSTSGVASILGSRLGVVIGATNGAGNFGPFIVPGVIWAEGQAFSVGDVQFTVVLVNGAMLVSSGTATGTFNTATGSVQINGAAALTDVVYYPALPVMGIWEYEQPTLFKNQTFAWDTQFAYLYNAVTGWRRIGTAVWSGTDSDFFWAWNYQGINPSDNLLFVTNETTVDLIRYWDGAVWTNYAPVVNSLTGDVLQTCRMIVAFKDRLIALNPTYGGVNYQNQLLYSALGNPLDPTSWDRNTPGKGSSLPNSGTQEAIVACEFIKDRLIVFYERSTWEVVFTNNDLKPFRWQKINTELGVEATFSTVPFDKVILSVGQTGLHACNGANLERIDDKIPEEVFENHFDNNAIDRIWGIRDYRMEMAYWTWPEDINNNQVAPTFPRRILCYNYKTGAWSFNADSLTAFGYWQDPVFYTPASGVAPTKQVIAGNQQGWMMIINPDRPRNTQALQITNITFVGTTVTLTVYNHNLAAFESGVNDQAQYIWLENITGTLAASLNNMIFPIDAIIDDNTIQIIAGSVPVGTYTGQGTIARVSNINFYTKQWNPFDQQGKNVYIGKLDFLVDRTTVGQVVVDYFPSSSDVSPISNQAVNNVNNTVMGTGILETSPYPVSQIPLEQNQDRLWHSIYLQVDGECIQLRIHENDTQLRSTLIQNTDFQMHAIVLHASSIGRLQ